MTFNVEISARALADADEYLEYLNRRSHFQDIGRLWWSRLMASLESLQEMPERCALYPGDLGTETGLRYLLFGAHRIVFKTEASRSRVVIVRILHSARRPQ